ncbi:MAG: polyphosphate kinase 1 [Anaerolineae bacterium]
MDTTELLTTEVPTGDEPFSEVHAPETYQNREVSWLGFGRRVLAQVEDRSLPLLERVKFAGIMGMLHDEYFMKRASELRRQMVTVPGKLSLDGLRPAEEFEQCRDLIVEQMDVLSEVLLDDLRPALERAGVPILDHDQLDAEQREALREHFRHSILPILTPLAVDPEHPFPFISGLVLNLAVILPDEETGQERFVRVKVPDNRPRWVPLPDGKSFVPLEQVIAANLDLMFPATPPLSTHVFRVTRAVEGALDAAPEQLHTGEVEPGYIVQFVSSKLKARRFASAVRLEVDPSMPKPWLDWLVEQLAIEPDDVYPTPYFIGLSDLGQLKVPDAENLRYPVHEPATAPRLRHLERGNTDALFEEIRRGDILVHHPYDSFDTSVLRFIEAAAVDPDVLAIKLTIYRTSRDSPIVLALAEAARRGKQVAVLVEITAKFDEEPNIAWGEMLEKEGVHVSYGVESLKTHVKLALVVREEKGRVRRYAHIGTGNYHSGTAKIYEDLGLLTCDQDLCDDAAAVFNTLTGATSHGEYKKLLVAPVTMRARFTELVRREIEHARAGRPSGITAKMNQLQDPDMIRELYAASQAGVPISLNVRGLCCLRPGVPGLSDNIEVYSVIGRFLEHSRIYRFTNGGEPEYFIGSADWMKRNLNKRVETITPVEDSAIQRQLDRIIAVYERDNCSAWDGMPDGSYVRRTPADGEPRRCAQATFIELAEHGLG